MFRLGGTELFLILAIVVLLFGAGRLPQIGSGIGESIRNFKKAIREKDGEADSRGGDDRGEKK